MSGQWLDSEFGQPLAVETLLVSVAVNAACADGGRLLLRLAPWQAEEVAEEITAWCHGDGNRTARRCGWRTEDGDHLMLWCADTDGMGLMVSGPATTERFDVGARELVLLGDDCRSACELVEQLADEDLVQAAIEGWA